MTANLKSGNHSPGEVIRISLEDKGWTQEDLAQILSLSTKHINEIIKDKRPLSFELITNIAAAFRFSEEDKKDFAEINTKFQLNHIDKDKEVENKANLYKLFPVGEMIKKGWISRQADSKGLLKELTKVFGFKADSFEELEKEVHFNRGDLRISYRNSSIENLTYSEVNRFTWCFFAKQKASQINNIPSYDRLKLENLLENLSKYTNYPKIEDGIAEFLEKLNNSGVRFLVISHLQKTYTEGAAFNFEFGPTIVLTARTNRLDTFWFNMAHEIVHILKEHNNKGAMIDGEETLSKNNLNPYEQEANNEAGRVLKGEEILNNFKKVFNYIPESDVLKFSQVHNLHPSIIVGRLAWEGITSFSIIHRFKDTVKDKIPQKYIFD